MLLLAGTLACGRSEMHAHPAWRSTLDSMHARMLRNELAVQDTAFFNALIRVSAAIERYERREVH